MVEAAVIAIRFLQYAGAMILLGSSLFFLYAVHGPRAVSLTSRIRWALASSAAILCTSSLLSIGLQASLFSGSFAEGFTLEGFSTVVSFMDLGKVALIRAVAAFFCLVAVLFMSGKHYGWLAVVATAGIATASLGWMGHGAATGNFLHLVANMVHALAAALWVGALAGFLILLSSVGDRNSILQLETALLRFSSIGVPLVIVLSLSGGVNSWVLVGWANLIDLRFTPYSAVLIAKLAVFTIMLLLAAVNRYRLTPALHGASDIPSVTHLRRSIATEAALGFAVLALVALLGTLEPPAVL